MTLFVRGNFVSRSGLALAWRIEGDALDAEDKGDPRRNLCRLAVPAVIGIADGLVPFAMALRQYAADGTPGC